VSIRYITSCTCTKAQLIFAAGGLGYRRRTYFQTAFATVNPFFEGRLMN
jgi:hypothetical protein